MNTTKIKIAGRYAELLISVFENNLISAFLFGSVARGEDTELSDVDLMAVLRKPPAVHQLRMIGKPGRFHEIHGEGEFEIISCVLIPQDRFLRLIRMSAPREAVNPLREAVVLYDTGFVRGLKKEVELDIISLKDVAWGDYMR